MLCAIIVVSCTSSPKPGPALPDGAPDFSVLPDGGNVYLWADVIKARALLEALSFNGMKLSDASQVLDKTDTAVAALYPDTAPRRFFMAGLGKYPSFGAGISMGFSRDWKQVKSATGKRYWFNHVLNLGTALGSRLAFISDGDPLAPASGADPSPQDFEAFRKPCVLAGWINNAEAPLNRFLSGIAIPIQVPVESFYFGFIRAGEETGQTEKYETTIRVRTPTPSQAGALVSLLSIARNFMGFGGGGNTSLMGLLLTNLPVQDGAELHLRIPPLSAEEIARHISSFSDAR